MHSGVGFDLAEIGNAWTTATGAIALNLENSFGQWKRVHQCGSGVVRS